MKFIFPEKNNSALELFIYIFDCKSPKKRCCPVWPFLMNSKIFTYLLKIIED